MKIEIEITDEEMALILNGLVTIGEEIEKDMRPEEMHAFVSIMDKINAALPKGWGKGRCKNV